MGRQQFGTLVDVLPEHGLRFVYSAGHMYILGTLSGEQENDPAVVALAGGRWFRAAAQSADCCFPALRNHGVPVVEVFAAQVTGEGYVRQGQVRMLLQVIGQIGRGPRQRGRSPG